MKDLKTFIHFSKPPLTPSDDNRPHIHIRNSQSKPTGRVINPELMDKDTEIKKKLYEESLRNNGSWNSILNRTSNERYIIKKAHQLESNTFKSSIFPDEHKEPEGRLELRHKRNTSFTKYSTTTQIYSIPGGNKRNEETLKGKRVYKNSKKDYFYSNDRYQPVIMRENSNNEPIILGGYGYRNKNKSQILSANKNNYYSNKDEFNIKDAFGIPSDTIKQTGKARLTNQKSSINFRGAFGLPSGIINNSRKRICNYANRECPNRYYPDI